MEMGSLVTRTSLIGLQIQILQKPTLDLTKLPRKGFCIQGFKHVKNNAVLKKMCHPKQMPKLNA